jgi:cell division protein FtsB
MKPERTFSSPKTAIFIIIGLSFVLFLLYSIGESLYKKHSFQILFDDLQKENERLKAENESLEQQVILRQTKEYLDRFAKENFDLLNPGEKRLVLPIETPDLSDTKTLNALPQSLLLKELQKRKPIREQWWDVFLGKKE